MKNEEASKTTSPVSPLLAYQPITLNVGAAFKSLVDPEWKTAQKNVTQETTPINLVSITPQNMKGKQFFDDLLPLLRQGLFYESGVEIPAIQVRGDHEIPANCFQIEFNEQVVMNVTIPGIDYILVETSKKRLVDMKIPHLKGIFFPRPQKSCFWISAQYESCKEYPELKSFNKWNVQEYFIVALAWIIRKNIDIFCTPELIYQIIDAYRKENPALGSELFPGFMSKPELLYIFKNILKAGYPIRNLSLIFETVLLKRSKKTSLKSITEKVIKTLQSQKKKPLEFHTPKK